MFILLDNEKEEHGQSHPVSSKAPDNLSKPGTTATFETTTRSEPEPNKPTYQYSKYGETPYDVNFDFTCEWKKAINFRPGYTETFGYLLVWSGCGGLNLKQDITLVNPFSSTGQSQQVVFPEENPADPQNPGTVLKCAGVISEFKFSGEDARAPIEITAYVSKQNAADLHSTFSKALMEGTKFKTAIEVSWYIISCDGAGEKWYEAAHVQSFQNASANIATDQGKGAPGGQLKVKVSRESTSLDESDIRLYKFNFTMVPAPGKTAQLKFETSPGARVVRPWGGA